MEWIVVDDGEDKVEDLFEGVERVKYFYYPEKLKLGKKRNLTHEKSKGQIIVYMDDDDFYPPDRVSHAVDQLESDPNVLAAGSSLMYIYFKDTGKIFQFGPYDKSHATAGTFAFKRALLKETKYSDDACVAEEKKFLKNYTVPFVQLDPMKTILAFAHEHNSFDKGEVLNTEFVRKTGMKLGSFIKDQELKNLYKLHYNKSHF
jgi:glycosyltransferase involved in cell wall biosynthesis